jgi:cell wall-associated NlpC family hydrolase
MTDTRSSLDKRLNAYRPELADISLRGRIDASRFAAGRPAQVASPLLSLRRQPAETSMQLTQVLLGETVQVFDEKDGWAWVKLDRDGYVGHVAAAALSATLTPMTHEVATPSTLAYPKPDLKTQPATVLPMLSRVAMAGEEKDYAALALGRFVYKRHLRPVDTGMGDYVAVAERFLFAPYYWGGKTIHGLDCSGLVQVALHAVGQPCLRDSDMQEATLGDVLKPGEKLRRGDLVFWEGHVGIMADSESLLHANGFHMMVALEPLALATERIGKTGKQVTTVRRL